MNIQEQEYPSFRSRSRKQWCSTELLIEVTRHRFPSRDLRTRSILVQEYEDALESLARQKEVELVWIPRHMGIPANERTDQLARIGSEEPCQGPEPTLGISRGVWSWRSSHIPMFHNFVLRKLQGLSQELNQELYGPLRDLEPAIL
ncbi:hypothetical protein NQ315_012724 [Exocentrus adspersus]|uniref:RNase H type-1 domain-containing protein n=1 Tax=Exocentrus adspersus TaxID=1586481 RepID=A0AAV8VER9_9CUCU|nr:hypothetical protein NQ315_012724 [Exocentrus adspersus]